MTHHTWLRGADKLVDEYQARLALALDTVMGKPGQIAAESETARMALREFVSNARGKLHKARCQKVLAGLIGDIAKGPTVDALLNELEVAALAATPPDERDTVIPDKPVNPVEQDVSDEHPTRRIMGRPTEGPWDPPKSRRG